jgi:hypothetical protein
MYGAIQKKDPVTKCTKRPSGMKHAVNQNIVTRRFFCARRSVTHASA